MRCCAARRRPVRELLGDLRMFVEVVAVVGAKRPQCLCGRLSGPSLVEREVRGRDRVLGWARVGGSARMLRSGNVGPTYHDARLASFSCDNGHKPSLDPQAQGPTFRRTFPLYIVLEGRIAGKCVGPCHSWLGTRQGEETED